MKPMHVEEASAVIHVDCPVCERSLGIVEASTGSVEDFECTQCKKVYRVVVQMKAQGRARLSFFDSTQMLEEQYDQMHLPV